MSVVWMVESEGKRWAVSEGRRSGTYSELFDGFDKDHVDVIAVSRFDSVQRTIKSIQPFIPCSLLKETHCFMALACSRKAPWRAGIEGAKYELQLPTRHPITSC